MNQILLDKVFIPTIEGYVNHFKDSQGNHWYDYRDLCKEVLIPDREYNKIFYKWINENERNEINIGGRSLVKYVSTEGFKRIIERNYQRGMWIYEDLVNFEFHNKNYKNLDKKLDVLGDKISKGNIIDIVQSVDNIYQDKQYKELLYQFNPQLDKEKEELINNIREDVYMLDDLEAVDCIYEMKKKLGADNPEIREILYQKHKENGSKSSCPSWLKDIIK